MHKSKNYYEEEKFDNKAFYREQKTKRREEVVQIPIVGLESYFISDNGKVFSRKTDVIREIKPTDNLRGYLGIPLYSPLHKTTLGHAKRYYIHRLVAMAFIPNLENKPCVNHKNGNRKDNSVENLEWVTYKENTSHSQKINTFPIGSRVHSAKLTDDKVKEMRKYYNKNKITHEELGKMFGISRRVAGNIVHKKAWKHVQ